MKRICPDHVPIYLSTCGCCCPIRRQLKHVIGRNMQNSIMMIMAGGFSQEGIGWNWPPLPRRTRKMIGNGHGEAMTPIHLDQSTEWQKSRFLDVLSSVWSKSLGDQLGVIFH